MAEPGLQPGTSTQWPYWSKPATTQSSGMTLGLGIGYGLQGIGGLFSAYGAYQQGQQQAIIANMQSSAAQFEGKMQNLEMQINAYRWMQQSFRTKATQQVSAAAAGVSLDSESFQNIVNETMQAFQDDVRIMMKQGEIAELAGGAKAAAYSAQAGATQQAGYLNALTSLVRTGTGIMQSYVWSDYYRQTGRI